MPCPPRGWLAVPGEPPQQLPPEAGAAASREQPPLSKRLGKLQLSPLKTSASNRGVVWVDGNNPRPI